MLSTMHSHPAYAHSISLSSTAINESSGCVHFNIEQTISTPPPKSTGTHTSQGKHKATECDPIRTKEHIQQACDYFLSTGRQCTRLRNYTIFVLGISIGIRGNDLLALRISDVLNLDHTVKTSLSVYESKTGKMNYPSLNQKAQDAIAQYLASIPHYSFDDCLFPNRRGEPLDGDTLYQMMNTMGKKLNFEEHLGAHSLRKTFAYWNITLHPTDVNTLASLQEMLNHDSMRTTLRYAGLTRENHAKLYADLGSIFDDCDID